MTEPTPEEWEAARAHLIKKAGDYWAGWWKCCGLRDDYADERKRTPELYQAMMEVE